MKPSGSSAFLAIAFISGALLLFGGTAAACPMCKEALAPADPAQAQLARGWARSIYFMMATPYVVFAGLTLAIVRSARQSRRAKTS